MKQVFKINNLLQLLLVSSLLLACKPTNKNQETRSQTPEIVKPRVPSWHKNANIYEVNIRQFTKEGTFNAFAEHLPRLKEMGVDILWFMPIHEISLKNRKGELGSPYAVKDYYDVNPNYGTMDDFKLLLKTIHELGMYCILDWVPNHTGWDNSWITEHPDWYTKDENGNITDPIDPNTGKSWGWTDVADLNYDNPEMRIGMIDAMKFWIKDIGIDGFRVDVAHSVPVDFWEQCTDSLYAVKPLFMLAEAEVPELLNNGAFVMDYGWEMHHLLNEIAKSQGANKKSSAKLVQGNLVEGEESVSHKKNALDIDVLLKKQAQRYSKGYKMHFTSNHDENSWAGTEFERMGDSHLAFAVLTATLEGMPLIYNGQESAMDKQLAFFTKDEIPWGDFKYAGFYKTLLSLKHKNQALWNGEYGGLPIKIPTGNDENVYAFTRHKNGNKVVVIINLSSSQQAITLLEGDFEGEYTDVFLKNTVRLDKGQKLTLKPWQYFVYSNI